MSGYIDKEACDESIVISLPNKLKDNLLEIAETNYRNIQNEIVYILLEYVNKLDKKHNELSKFTNQFIEKKKRRKIFKIKFIPKIIEE